MPRVTVAIISRNMRSGLESCLQALFAQTFSDFEIVVVDDRSQDGTREMIGALGDRRVRYFRNDRRLGYGATRNLSLKEARGQYIFFTDADCLPTRNWLETGLRVFESRACIGIVGKTLPLGDSTKRSDRRVMNVDGRFMTCNMSFKREILEKLGGFDPAFDVGQEDVELGLRAKRCGEIVFASEMLVHHRIESYTFSRLFQDAARYKTQVMIFKRYRNDEYHIRYSPPIAHGIFLKPEDWRLIFFPFLLFKSSANQSFRDFLFIPFIFLAIIYRRLVIWKTAIRERILLI